MKIFGPYLLSDSGTYPVDTFGWYYQIYWSIKLLFAIIAMCMWGRDWSMTTHIWTLLVCH